MISIIIPAHNEEAVIGECLRTMICGARPGEIEIIVACNGCTDHTAQRAREAFADVKLVESPRPSKPESLNLGDQAATGFPRFYVDADIRITIEAIRATTRVLSQGGIHIASPRPQMDVASSSALVRAFYQVWLELPHIKTEIVGTGVYALSKEGRSRFGKFPDVIADDRFVRSLFKPEETRLLLSQRSLVTAPATIPDLVRIMTRARLGEVELAATGLVQNQQKRMTNKALAIGEALLSDSRLALGAPVYLSVTILARIRAWFQLRNRKNYVWERARPIRNPPKADNCSCT